MSSYKYVSGPEFIEQLNNTHSKYGMKQSNWTSDEMTWEDKHNKTVIIIADENWCNSEYTNDYNKKINRQKKNNQTRTNTSKVTRSNTSKTCPYFLKGICGDENNCNKFHPKLPHILRRKNKYG
uniref:C3H1-type domain-containing protein n=1 Tax=Mimivirus LCMiAC02 TaxID=2506609 RepID=A0A4D5XFQ4_9VIRU|nr:MAG: hypothetical protein LCMiAC02_03360 [Mimivirus LCMiAC02]